MILLNRLYLDYSLPEEVKANIGGTGFRNARFVYVDGTLVYDEREEIVYEKPQFEVSYDDAEVGADTLNPTVFNLSQKKYDKGYSGNSYNRGNAPTEGYGVAYSLSWRYSTSVTIDSSKGELYIPKRTDISNSYKKVAKVLVTLTANDVANTYEVEVYQKPNVAEGWEYENPVITSIGCEDIPAWGGTITEGSVTVTQRRRPIYSNSDTGAWEYVNNLSYTESWSRSVSGSDLGTEGKARTDKGYITCTVTANGKTSASKNVNVYQEANERELISTTAEYQYINERLSATNAAYIKDGYVRAAGFSSGSVFMLVDVQKRDKKVYEWTSLSRETEYTTWTNHETGLSSRNVNGGTITSVASLGTTWRGAPLYVGRVDYSHVTYGSTYKLVYQEPNLSESSIGVPVIESFSYPDVNATVGATVDPDIEIRVPEILIWTSGATSNGADSMEYDGANLIFNFYKYHSYFSVNETTGRVTVEHAYASTYDGVIYCKVKYGTNGTWSNVVRASITQVVPQVVGNYYIETNGVWNAAGNAIDITAEFVNKQALSRTFSDVTFYLYRTSLSASSATGGTLVKSMSVSDVTVSGNDSSERTYTMTGLSKSSSYMYWIGATATNVTARYNQVEDNAGGEEPDTPEPTLVWTTVTEDGHSCRKSPKISDSQMTYETISGKSGYVLHLKSNAESTYDYIAVTKTLPSSWYGSSGSGFVASTRGNQNTWVEYVIPDNGTYYIIYGKDGSASVGGDCGYYYLTSGGGTSGGGTSTEVFIDECDWFEDDVTGANGSYVTAWRSDSIDDNQYTYMLFKNASGKTAHIKSDAESSFDYIAITTTQPNSNTLTNVVATTQSNQNSWVNYPVPDNSIYYVVYRKDSSVSNGEDCGWFYIS